MPHRMSPGEKYACFMSLVALLGAGFLISHAARTEIFNLEAKIGLGVGVVVGIVSSGALALNWLEYLSNKRPALFWLELFLPRSVAQNDLGDLLEELEARRKDLTIPKWRTWLWSWGRYFEVAVNGLREYAAMFVDRLARR